MAVPKWVQSTKDLQAFWFAYIRTICVAGTVKTALHFILMVLIA